MVQNDCKQNKNHVSNVNIPTMDVVGTRISERNFTRGYDDRYRAP